MRLSPRHIHQCITIIPIWVPFESFWRNYKQEKWLIVCEFTYLKLKMAYKTPKNIDFVVFFLYMNNLQGHNPLKPCHLIYQQIDNTKKKAMQKIKFEKLKKKI